MKEQPKPPLPPFTYAQAVEKVRKAEDAWNAQDPDAIAMAYTADSRWRNRDEIFQGRDAIRKFLERKWQRELEYRLIKEIWAHRDERIAVRFVYEWHDVEGNWYRSYGNENWKFAADGRMDTRHASINDMWIQPNDRKLLWPAQGIRPIEYPGLTELVL